MIDIRGQYCKGRQPMLIIDPETKLIQIKCNQSLLNAPLYYKKYIEKQN